MVAINITQKYSEEELTAKGGQFYCGSGYVKCLIVSNEIADSRYATATNPKPKVLKVHYHVAAGEYQGAENDVEFELWNTEHVDFGNGRGMPADQLAGQNFRAISLACGFDKTVNDSDLLNGKFLMINHDIQKGQAIEEENEYGQKTPKLNSEGKQEFYPDRSNVAKGKDKFKPIPAVGQVAPAPAQVAPAVGQVAPQAPVAAPVAPAPLPPVSGAMPLPVPQAAPALPQSVASDGIPF